MCGFVAILGKKAEQELTRMSQAVARRGPDDQGEFDDGSFAAIHHRLSIIGPDVRGRQPMTIDGITVLFNGCIYNYRELKKQLEEDGIHFASKTDTEILPYLYRRFGAGMFSLLNGMYAMVLWDARENQLVVARDPFGEKPLFICEQRGRVGLASMLSAFEQGDWQLTPNLHAVNDVLCRMRVEAPHTMYQEVSQLSAGCYAIARPGDTLQLRRYFFLPEPDQPQGLTPDEIEGAAAQLMDAAFVQRTVSDKPLGVFLSGGVDSSLIAESLARHLPQGLHTFSVRFPDADPSYDESSYAKKVADHIGSEHVVLDVQADAHTSLYNVAAAFDQPVANATALPTYLVCQAAKKHVDVALTGIGGDELFGGYPRYLGMLWHGRMHNFPGRSFLLTILRFLGEGAGHRNLRGRLRRFLEGLDEVPSKAYGQWTSSGSEEWEEIFTEPLPVGDNQDWVGAATASGGLEGLLERFGPVNGAMAYDVLTYLPDDLLAMGDRMSMAHALELRSPFLDTRLLSLVLTMNASYKVTGPPWREGLKLMLKRIASKRLPAEVIDRPKQGFMTPVKHWLRDELAGEIEGLIHGRPLGGMMHTEFISKVWQEHIGGRDRSDMLWAIMLLDSWMRQREWKF